MASKEYSEHLNNGDSQGFGDDCRDFPKEKRSNAKINPTIAKESEDNSNAIQPDPNNPTPMRGAPREHQDNAPNAQDNAHAPKYNGQNGIKCDGQTPLAADNFPTDRQNAKNSVIRSSETNDAVPKRSVPQNPPVAIERLSAAQKRNVQDRELSVLLRRQGRAFSQALMTIAGTRQRSGRLWLICGATLIVIAMLLIQVRYKHRDLNLGYTLSEAISTREALLEENRKLRIELRVLSRRERLEPYATQQLGMAPIRPDQILIVRQTIPANASDAQNGSLKNTRRIAD